MICKNSCLGASCPSLKSSSTLPPDVERDIAGGGDSVDMGATVRGAAAATVVSEGGSVARTDDGDERGDGEGEREAGGGGGSSPTFISGKRFTGYPSGTRFTGIDSCSCSVAGGLGSGRPR